MSVMMTSADNSTSYVRNKLRWMRSNQIWPNGQRYLWTDAFGVVLLVSLYEKLDDRYFSMKLNGWCPRLTGCLVDHEASVLARHRTGTGSIFITLQCGSTHLPSSRATSIPTDKKALHWSVKFTNRFWCRDVGLSGKWRKILAGPTLASVLARWML